MRVSEKKRVAVKKALGPGVHLGVVEMRSGSSYRVKLMAGGHARATRGPGVGAAAVDRWMDQAQTVVLADGDRGPLLVGALEKPLDDEGRGGARLVSGRSIRIDAEDEITLTVGSISLKLNKAGAAELKGEKLVIDVAAIMKVLAARVELP